MFDLPAEPPSASEELAVALEWSVRRRIHLSDAAAVRCSESALEIDLTRGRVDVDASTGGLPEHLRPPTLVANRRGGPRFDRFRVKARPLIVTVEGGGAMPLDIEIDGSHVAFDFGTSAAGRWVMAPSSGHLTATLSVPSDDLLRVVRAKAMSEAAARGVRLDEVDADVRAGDKRTLLVNGRLKGSKKVAFLNASFAIDFAMQFVAETDPSGDLVGRVRDVRVHGDGAILNVLLTLARPAIDRVAATPLPLADLLATVGVQGLRVREVDVRAGELLTLRAEFVDR